MKLKFYGTRGSSPTAMDAYQIEDKIKAGDSRTYGGNTTCLEVITKSGDEYIFDAGSGARVLGNELFSRGFAPGQGGQAKIFLTHLHWDHIQGLPFFGPAYIPTNKIIVHGEPKVNKNLKELLEKQMADPYFPVPLNVQGGFKDFVDLEPGRTLENGIAIGYWSGNHPNGSLVYALREGPTKVVFASDYEHDGQALGKKFGPIDQELIKFAHDADILIMDGQYTPEEYLPCQNFVPAKGSDFKKEVSELMKKYPQSKIGWGHSTYEQAINIAVETKAKQLVLTHHDPNHTDRQLDEILERAQHYLKTTHSDSGLKVTLAYDGLEIKLQQKDL